MARSGRPWDYSEPEELVLLNREDAKDTKEEEEEKEQEEEVDNLLPE